MATASMAKRVSLRRWWKAFLIPISIQTSSHYSCHSQLEDDDMPKQPYIEHRGLHSASTPAHCEVVVQHPFQMIVAQGIYNRSSRRAPGDHGPGGAIRPAH